MKQINIKANLDESEFRKKLKDIESGKYDVNINVNSKNTVQGLNNISNSAKNTTTVFGRLKNVVSGTFSSRKIETTAYLALLKEINDAAERAKDTMVQLDKVVTDLSEIPKKKMMTLLNSDRQCYMQTGEIQPFICYQLSEKLKDTNVFRQLQKRQNMNMSCHVWQRLRTMRV